MNKDSIADWDSVETLLKDNNLSDQDLKGIDLSECNLGEKYFVNTNLYNANLANTRLINAIFCEANLENADLRGCYGLSYDSLAGANLKNAKFSEDMIKFAITDSINEASKLTRTIFLIMIGACVYIYITILVTNAASLINNSTISALPLIGQVVSIDWFFSASSILLSSIFIYFQFNLLRLSESIAKCPAIFPDGTPLYNKIYP